MDDNSGSQDDVPVAAKKDNVLERLNKRNKERQIDLEVKLEERSKESLENEGVDYFSETFSERVRDIEKAIGTINEQTAKASNSSELARQFADVTVKIQELQRYLTSSTRFLTEFKIKLCQNSLNELSVKCENTRKLLMPKKKFGFSAKKVPPKATEDVKTETQGDKVDVPEKLVVKKHRAQFTWTLENHINQHICLRDEEVNNKDITISNLTDCLVELQGHAGSVQISKAVNCIFLCGPIARSLFAENCTRSTFAAACQQLRLHSSSSCHLHLHVTCRAIIEDCSSIDVGIYDYDYAGIENDFEKAGLDRSQNNYTDVADFNWLSPDVPSPNWRLSSDRPRTSWEDERNKYKNGPENETAL